MLEIFVSKNVCEILNISYRQLDYALRKIGDVRRASTGLRLFTQQDILKIRDYLDNRRKY